MKVQASLLKSNRYIFNQAKAISRMDRKLLLIGIGVFSSINIVSAAYVFKNRQLDKVHKIDDKEAMERFVNFGS